MINPLWLRSLLAVVATGSFTRAAERLDITQAAVSQHIRHLEDRYGRLLLRERRQVELTPQGRLLFEYAEALAAATARLRARLADDDPTQGTVSLATPGSIGLALYPCLLDLQASHPGLQISHRFAPSAQIAAMLLDGQIEFGLSTRPPDDARLEASEFVDEALRLVLPAGHPKPDWGALQRLGMIGHPDCADMAARLFARCYPGQRVSTLPERGFVNQIGLILEPVARGLGFTVLPQFALSAFGRPAGLYVVEQDPPVVDMLWLVTRREWPLSAAASHALEAMRAHLAAMQGRVL
ncbi:LysR family transcriptional regulator [Crenobacter sp. HX-7-9]|uniref:LysR family transcriptional regulator n=1 Tax=Crenobacter caeni TaxID=2705474 RepID=A0A6B2KNS8_9NEIS|nr:LysR family transcriptional regulator [Crenobacter caeni]